MMGTLLVSGLVGLVGFGAWYGIDRLMVMYRGWRIDMEYERHEIKSKMRKENSEVMVKRLEKLIEDDKESIKRYEERLLDESLSEEMRKHFQGSLELFQEKLESDIEVLKLSKKTIKECEEEIEKYSKHIK